MIEIRHTGLVTKNIKESLLFWTKYLKFKIHKEMDEEGDLIDKIMLYKNAKLKTLKLKDKKVKFDFNKLIMFDSKEVHRGMGPKKLNTPRITLAFKTKRA